MSVIIRGGNSGVNADVESSSKALLTKLIGGITAITGSNGDPINLTDTGSLRVSAGALVFYDQIEGAVVNTNLWAQSTDTETIAIVSEYLTLNSGGITTANKYAVLQSVKQLPLYSNLPLRVVINAMVNVQPQSNLTIELGLGVASGIAVPTDGCFFRWNAQAQFVAVINNGGTETSSGALTGTITDVLGNSVTLPPASNVTHLFALEVVENAVEFFVDDVLVATVNVPAGQAYPTNAGHQPLLARSYNGASAPSQAGQLSIGQAIISQDDISQNKPWSEVLAGMGRGAYQGPITTFGQLANHANSTSPASATLSNTAAGYTTLGGRYQFAAPAGAATDFALFAFQVPVPYQFYVTGIAISGINTGSIGGLTGTILDWSAGVNASAVSLATADGAGTWAPRRIALGMQSYPISAPIGQVAGDIVRQFNPPLVVDSGRFFHVILQVPAGLATGSQIIRGDVMVTGYFE